MNLKAITIASFLTVICLVTVTLSAEESNLATQKSRLLDRIIKTEDDALRERLLTVYEALEETEETNADGETGSPNNTASAGNSNCVEGNCRNGQGTYILKGALKYVGQFKDALFHGQGTLIGANGNKYVGHFKDASFHGQGTYIWANGDKYVGSYKDGDSSGQGTLFGADGTKYVGNYEDGLMNGQGTYIWANGNKYVGHFKDDVRSGQGTMTWESGAYYFGQWQNNMRHGEGTLSFANGKPRKGVWWQDEYEGKKYSRARGREILGMEPEKSFGKKLFEGLKIINDVNKESVRSINEQLNPCGPKPFPKPNHVVGRCVNGQWEQIHRTY